MSKYEMLVNVLDGLIEEAPTGLKKYTGDVDKNQIRARAYIHLFLKSNFNLSDFTVRESYILDGPHDGGIDAYYIDKDNLTIYFIQSKFRATEENFEHKFITIDELTKMSINNILKGDTTDEDGNEYNGKIKKMQRIISDLDNLPRYKYEIILLANVDQRQINKEAIERLVQKWKYTIIDYKNAYSDLLYPLLKGLSHQAGEVTVRLNLDGKNSNSMDYEVEIEDIKANVQVFFVPTLEIAVFMNEYKNSILQYNPRSYIGVSESGNHVNNHIKQAILDKKSNEFSLFNNGITMISDETLLQTKTGKQGEAQLQILNPEIINGGQTANTLAHIYSDKTIDNTVFGGKEVLTKIITFSNVENEETKTQVIEALSRATNFQSVVRNADRRSNDAIQIRLQDYIFDNWGYGYNRKDGEFYDSLAKGYINSEQVIDRSILLRIANVNVGKVSNARRSGEDTLFKDQMFHNALPDDVDMKKIMYGYFVYKGLNSIEEIDATEAEPFVNSKYGNGLRYGKYAIVGATLKKYDHTIDETNLENVAIRDMNKIINNWKEFENHIEKKEHNRKYFYVDVNKKNVNNYDGYYKGSTLDEDIRTYQF